jgi:hypothetical protein
MDKAYLAGKALQYFLSFAFLGLYYSLMWLDEKIVLVVGI